MVKYFFSKINQYSKYALVMCFVVPTQAAELEEIIVTAQKREQSLQDVGISVTAFTGDALEELGFDDPRDLMMQTPDLMVSYNQGSNIPNFTVRGVGLIDFAPNNSSPVAVHLDDVYYSYTAFLNFGLFDIERAEVLKGPQGTLFGRNTTGGAVSFFSRRPAEDFESSLKLGLGNYGAKRADFMINGSLGDGVNGRVAGFYKNQSEGPWRSRVTGEDLGEIDHWWGLRGLLEFEPTEDLNILVNIHGGSEDSESAQYDLLPALNIDGSGTGCPAYLAGTIRGGESNCVDVIGNTEPDDGPFSTGAGFVNTQKLEGWGTNIHIDWDLGGMAFTSITAYETIDRLTTEDADGQIQIIDDLIYENEIEQFTQEFRLSGDSDNLIWLVGAFLSTDEINTLKHEFLGFDWIGIGANAHYLQESDSYAAFANLEFSLRDDLKLITGVRYTDETRKFNGGTELTLPPENYQIGDEGVPTGTFLGRVPEGSEETSFSNVSWKLGLDWAATDDVLTYASISKGFKSGGYNGQFAFAGDFEYEPFDEESLVSYEVGVKSTLADGAMRLNASVYVYDYKDIIIQSSVDTVVAGEPFTVFRFSNAADATVKGAEVSLDWKPSDAWDFSFGGAYIDSELENAKPGNESFNGNRLDYTPEFSANWSGRYEAAMKSGKSVFVQVDGTYKGDFETDTPDTSVTQVDAYSLWNGRLGLISENENWNVALYGQNLFDEEYIQYVNDILSLGDVLNTYGYRRTYGVEVSFKW